MEAGLGVGKGVGQCGKLHSRVSKCKMYEHILGLVKCLGTHLGFYYYYYYYYYDHLFGPLSFT